MTTDYGCALGGPDHKVSWLVTHLQPAMTISLCDEDFPVGVIPLLASELGVDPGRLYDSVKRFVDREQAREAKERAQHKQAEYDDGIDAVTGTDAEQDQAARIHGTEDASVSGDSITVQRVES